MVAGCPADARLWSCLYQTYPDFYYFAGAVAVGFFLVWRRWALLLLALVLVGTALLLRTWGVVR